MVHPENRDSAERTSDSEPDRAKPTEGSAYVKYAPLHVSGTRREPLAEPHQISGTLKSPAARQKSSFFPLPTTYNRSVYLRYFPPVPFTSSILDPSKVRSSQDEVRSGFRRLDSFQILEPRWTLLTASLRSTGVISGIGKGVIGKPNFLTLGNAAIVLTVFCSLVDWAFAQDDGS
jgi:hypothetical protein